MKIRIYSDKEVVEVGRFKAKVGPRSDIAVPSSPEGNVPQAGRKCEHGNYIPATFQDDNHAPFCSLCYPYEIKEKE